jgi:hypothetical protein
MSTKDGFVKLWLKTRHPTSRRIPRTARIWLTLTLGTTDEKASTNSYANLNHPTSSRSEFENVRLGGFKHNVFCHETGNDVT